MQRILKKLQSPRALAPVALLLVLGAGLLYYFQEDNPYVTDYEVGFSGRVIVIGAGSSGLTAAYLLEREGIDVVVIEAQDVYGGRMREASDFADFPIDLGAEWIHDDPSILTSIVNDENVSVDIETITYQPQTLFSWDGSKLSDDSWQSALYKEYKFKDTTWFSFFDEYIVPPIKDTIVLSEPVSSIDYSGDQVIVSTVDNKNFEPANTYTADKVLVTVPITVLQNEYISFSPALPQPKVDAINSITVPDGIKVFIEFSEKFYPDILTFNEFSEDDGSEEKIYYDAAFGKDTDRNILGLFTIGSGAEQLVGKSDEEIIEFILAELDTIYDGKASKSYVKHITQNWSSQAFIEGAYSTNHLNDWNQNIDTIAEPLDAKVYFAGEALSKSNQATVHGAAGTAFDAVRAMIEAR